MPKDRGQAGTKGKNEDPRKGPSSNGQLLGCTNKGSRGRLNKENQETETSPIGSETTQVESDRVQSPRRCKIRDGPKARVHASPHPWLGHQQC